MKVNTAASGLGNNMILNKDPSNQAFTLDLKFVVYVRGWVCSGDSIGFNTNITLKDLWNKHVLKIPELQGVQAGLARSAFISASLAVLCISFPTHPFYQPLTHRFPLLFNYRTMDRVIHYFMSNSGLQQHNLTTFFSALLPAFLCHPSVGSSSEKWPVPYF